MEVRNFPLSVDEDEKNFCVKLHTYSIQNSESQTSMTCKKKKEQNQKTGETTFWEEALNTIKDK